MRSRIVAISKGIAILSIPLWVIWAFVAFMGLGLAIGDGGVASVGWSGLVAATLTYLIYPVVLVLVLRLR